MTLIIIYGSRPIFNLTIFSTDMYAHAYLYQLRVMDFHFTYSALNKICLIIRSFIKSALPIVIKLLMIIIHLEVGSTAVKWQPSVAVVPLREHLLCIYLMIINYYSNN